MRRLLAAILVFSFLMPLRSFAQTAPETVRDSVRTFGVGKKVEVRTTSGTRLRGRIESISDSAFTLQRRGSGGGHPGISGSSPYRCRRNASCGADRFVER